MALPVCCLRPGSHQDPAVSGVSSITGNFALCEVIKVESICSGSAHLTPELLLTRPATGGQASSPPRLMTHDVGVFSSGWGSRPLFGFFSSDHALIAHQSQTPASSPSSCVYLTLHTQVFSETLDSDLKASIGRKPSQHPIKGR